MEFREFLENEEAKYFDEGLNEWLDAPLKFAAGAVGNALSQTGRAVGNTAVGVAQGARGLGRTATGALQYLGGGAEKGKESLSKGGSDLYQAGGRLLRGVAQGAGVASFVTPALRGAQAASEPFFSMSGVYAPSSPNRTSLQDLAGLDSWEKPDAPKPAEEPKDQKKPDETAVFLQGLEREQKKRDQDRADAWKNLVHQYRAAKTEKERKELRRKMRQLSPMRYQQAVEAGMKRLARKSI